MRNNEESKIFIGGGLDDFGRTFLYKNKIYRAISKQKTDFCKKLFVCGLIEKLQKENLIPKTEISQEVFEGSNLVLEHEKLTMSNPSEWSFSMLKDAAKLVLQVNEICNEFGYQLKDSHPWNILFKKNKPIFIDIGSIDEAPAKAPRAKWVATKEFAVSFIYPLILLHQNEIYLAKKIFQDGQSFYMGTIPASKIEDSKAILSSVRKFLLRKYFPLFIASYIMPRKTVKLVAYMSIRCKKIFQKLKFGKKKTQWSDYQDDFYGSNFDPKNKEFLRFNEIANIINGANDCTSIVDLAGNSGTMSLFILRQCQKISKIINTDYDELAIDRAYLEMAKNDINIESYVLNFMLPYNPQAGRNFNSDIVLALAVTHHLILTQGFEINFIFEKIKSYAKKYVFIEFMPLGLYYGDDNNIPPIPNWYNQEWFKDNFEKHFDLEIVKKLEKNRVLFVGKIKDNG